MTTLQTPRLLLRPPRGTDVSPLTAILAEPGVARYWHGYDEADVREELVETPYEGLTVFTIEHEGVVVGHIQFFEQNEPDYRSANIDLFLGERWQGRGLGGEAVHAVARHLVRERGHHRLTIDPAADNHRAIRVYERVGFRRVGIMRKYERGPDGSWHDGLLMDLLAEDLAP